jgi:hypothetical protein
MLEILSASWVVWAPTDFFDAFSLCRRFLLLWQRFVAGDLGYEIRHFRSKAFRQLFSGDVHVFDRVME